MFNGQKETHTHLPPGYDSSLIVLSKEPRTVYTFNRTSHYFHYFDDIILAQLDEQEVASTLEVLIRHMSF